MTAPTAARRTRIIATLGPATDAPGVLESVLKAGVDVVRLNFSHGTRADHARRVAQVRAIAQRIGREIGVLADLAGPKIRIERFAQGPVVLAAGADFTLDCRADAPPGDASRVGVSYTDLPGDVAAGDVLLLADGLISLEVALVDGASIHTRVIDGGKLSDRKGLNRRGGGLSLGALTDSDRADIKIAAELGVDFIAVSFCRSAADIEETRALLSAAGGQASIIAKIERSEAIEQLAEIINVSDVVMVARGDLGVEIGDAELPGLQKRIIRETLAQDKIAITATQMLQSMVDSPIPTRAEVLDVANAVIDGTDAVMLSEETAAGRYPKAAVEAMVRICLGAERQFHHDTDFKAAARDLTRTDQAIAMATMFLTEHVAVRAILALTESGSTARWLSRFRSQAPIYALSRHADARRRMAMMRDVFPIAFDSRGLPPLEAAQAAITHLYALGFLADGDRVLATSGDQMQHSGSTNTLRLLKVAERGQVEDTDEL